MKTAKHALLPTLHATALVVALCPLASLAPCRGATDATNTPASPTNAALQLKMPEAAKSTPAPPVTTVRQTSGDLVLMGQSAVIGENETVTGAAVVVAGNLTINGKVNGDAVCVGGTLKVGPSAQIGGDLVTVGSAAEIDPAAKIGGNKVNVASFPLDLMKHLGPIVSGHGKVTLATPDRAGKAHHQAVFFFFLEIAFFGLLAFIALLMTTFIPAQFTRVTEHVEGDFGRSALLGLTLMIVLPVALIILAITVVGLPLVPLAVLAVGLGQLVGYVAFGHALGHRWFGSRGPMFQTMIGLAVLQAAAILGDIINITTGPRAPLGLALGALGMLIFIAGSFVGLGAIVSSRAGRRSLAQTTAARKPAMIPPPQPGPT